MLKFAMLTRKLREIRVALLLCGLGSFTAAFAAPKPDKPDPSDTFFTDRKSVV